MSDIAAFIDVSVELTAGGASAEVEGIFELEPMCMQTTVSVSAQAREERVPVAVGVVDRRQPEEGRDLREADGVAPAGRVPPDLVGREAPRPRAG